jgi:hypothetical protein
VLVPDFGQQRAAGLFQQHILPIGFYGRRHPAATRRFARLAIQGFSPSLPCIKAWQATFRLACRLAIEAWRLPF